MPVCPWPGLARRAILAVGLWLAGQGACGAQTAEILGAAYLEPTEAYAHGVLGDAIEYRALRLTVSGGGPDRLFRLGPDHVFEDIAPRLVDLDLDGRSDAVLVVETDMARGAAMALYGADGKLAETPHIGRSNRWLAPVGAADLDGDGRVELAYVDRPHLAKTLRIWRYEAGNLTQVAEAPGLTNHQIGQGFISGGIRDCGAGPEMILADGRWQTIMAARLQNGQITTRALGPYSGPKDLQTALSCTN